MNRRSFFGGLLAAACASALKFYPAPRKPELVRPEFPGPKQSRGKLHFTMTGGEPFKTFTCPGCGDYYACAEHEWITSLSHSCETGSMWVQGYLKPPMAPEVHMVTERMPSRFWSYADQGEIPRSALR